jgi:hypothetical protein
VEAGYVVPSRALVEFEGSVRGLEIGAPVEALGIPIGRVVDSTWWSTPPQRRSAFRS